METGRSVRIALLADHPEAVPALAKAFEAEWPSHYGAACPGDATRDLDACLRRTDLPIGFVAFHGDEPCGTMALKAESITIRPHLGPWAAGGWVDASRRRRGIGAALLCSVEATARSLGFPRLYGGTSTAARLFERNGWTLRERVFYGGEDVGIYEKEL